MKMKMILICVLAIVLAGSLTAEPSDSSPSVEAQGSCADAHQPIDLETANALRVVIDAETGRLRAPTAEEAAALRAEKVLPRNIESMPVEKAADGTLTVRLGGAFLKAAIAQRGPSGDLTITHDAIPTTPESAVRIEPATVEQVLATEEAATEETATEETATENSEAEETP